VAYQPLSAPALPVAIAQPVVQAPQQQGMTAPEMHFPSGPGAGSDPFAILGQLAGVTIKQQIQWAQVLVGFGQGQKYLISDSSGRDLFVAAERNDGLMGMLGRQVFEGGFRPFNLDIAMLQGPAMQPVPFVRLERPFKCTCLCFGRPHMNIYNALTNQLIGSTHEPYSCCHYRLHMQDDGGRDVLNVNHHCCDFSLLCWGCPCGCQETNFEIRDGDQVVGNIRRQFNMAQAIGMVTGIEADSDQFHVDFKDVQSPDWKAALIATAIFLDYCYFVKSGQSARRESALGRAERAFGQNQNWN